MNKVNLPSLCGGRIIDRVRVSSSNLKDVSYDPEQRILKIGFLNGGVYQYFNVPESKHAGLMRVESKGGYLDEYIKKPVIVTKKSGDTRPTAG